MKKILFSKIISVHMYVDDGCYIITFYKNKSIQYINFVTT